MGDGGVLLYVGSTALVWYKFCYNEIDWKNISDLPPVTLPGFNGGLEHLVKEDLLGESDSSESNKVIVDTCPITCLKWIESTS